LVDTRAGTGYAASWTTEGTSGETTVTEEEWLTSTDPQAMLAFFLGKTSERKLRLFALACWRRSGGGSDKEWRRESLRVYELLAEGSVTDEELAAIGANRVDIQPAALDAADAAGATRDAGPGERATQADLLRCIFGNPFRPFSIDPAWLTWHDGLLVSMARQMYDSRDFTDMPILADALEEAGCQDQDILGHCRSGGEHVRGCCVVDLILGKE
jgi:hypothetical protein